MWAIEIQFNDHFGIAAKLANELFPLLSISDKGLFGFIIEKLFFNTQK